MATLYRSNTYIPEFVQAAKILAQNNGFEHSCTDAAGRLLAIFAAQTQGKILEIGTGYGVGSAWIVSAIHEKSYLYSIDCSEEKIMAVANQLSHPQATFVCGDWKELSSQGPFQFIFVDAAAAKTTEGELLIDSLAVGGMLFMDDFTPEEHFPKEWIGKPDTVREFWLNHPRLMATEIYLTPKTAAIIATKVK